MLFLLEIRLNCNKYVLKFCFSGRGGPLGGARGATRGAGPNGRGSSVAPLGRGRGSSAAQQNMMQQSSYGTESYDYVSALFRVL